MISRNRAAALVYGVMFFGFWWGGTTCTAPGAPGWLAYAIGFGGVGLVLFTALVYALGKRAGAKEASGKEASDGV